jgi:hypothetical protein
LRGGCQVIDDATKRLGGTDDSRCRVTVTDRFGGRGHDFQVNDKEVTEHDLAPHHPWLPHLLSSPHPSAGSYAGRLL